jgi:hypothetical protein
MAPEISSSWPWRTGADSLEVPIPYIFGLCNVRPIFTDKKTQLDGLKNGTNVPPSVGSWRSPIDDTCKYPPSHCDHVGHNLFSTWDKK